jgi:hypothetical protein
VGELSIGAEFLVRSLPSPDGMLTPRGYLVVEVAVFGPPVTYATLSSSLFSLRVNGAKAGILAQSPFLVERAFDPPPAGTDPSLTVGNGNGGIIFGDPGGNPGAGPNSAPLPLPRDPSSTPMPRRPPTPPITNAPRYEPMPPAEVVKRAALPSGELRLPQAGVLFFAYPGDSDKIRTVELIYEGPARKGSITLR